MLGIISKAPRKTASCWSLKVRNRTLSLPSLPAFFSLQFPPLSPIPLATQSSDIMSEISSSREPLCNFSELISQVKGDGIQSTLTASLLACIQLNLPRQQAVSPSLSPLSTLFTWHFVFVDMLCELEKSRSLSNSAVAHPRVKKTCPEVGVHALGCGNN